VKTIVPEAAPGVHVPPVTITGSGVPLALTYTKYIELPDVSTPTGQGESVTVACTPAVKLPLGLALQLSPEVT
jgi:hypothetical protein